MIWCEQNSVLKRATLFFIFISKLLPVWPI